jgi:hypothetical protein
MPNSPAPETGPEPTRVLGETRPSCSSDPECATNEGLEIRLYDPNRKPQNWTDCMRPNQCAVLLKDRTTSTPLSPEGRPYPSVTDCTCLLFDGLDVAQRFCETKVKALPFLCCEVFNSEGRAKPPLLVITHPDYQRDDDSGPASSRRRMVLAALLLAGAAGLFSINLRGESIMATLLASNCALLGLRFLYWEYAVKHREQDRLRRLEAHRRIERGDA